MPDRNKLALQWLEQMSDDLLSANSAPEYYVESLAGKFLEIEENVLNECLLQCDNFDSADDAGEAIRKWWAGR